MKQIFIRIILIITPLFLFITSCENESPTQPNESSFNEKFYRKYYKMFGRIINNQDSYDFHSDENFFFDLQNSGNFNLRISGYSADSSHINFETSGKIEVLSKQYKNSGFFHPSLWEGKLKIVFESNLTYYKDFTLVNYYNSLNILGLTVEISDSCFLEIMRFL